jgi:hemerythrin-like domain-containing protein
MPTARVRVKYVTRALRKHHDRILEALQLLYKALEARDAETLYKLVKFAQGFVDASHHSVEELILFHGAVRGGFPYEEDRSKSLSASTAWGGSWLGAWWSSTLPGGPATRAH